MFDKQELRNLKEKFQNLKKSNNDLIITDFDDTIFSTKEVIDKDYRKWRRWKQWNDFIIENNLIDKIVEEVYIDTKYPSIITSKLRKNHDLILTVWIEEFQTKKIIAANVNHINVRIVPSAEDKVAETIRYVVDELWFIPSKITIYEDRPKYFIEYKNFIEDFLWTKLEIMLVEMESNNSEPKIKKLD